VRFGIVMVPPSRIGSGLTSAGGVQLYVVPIEQNLLDIYLKSPQPVMIQSVPISQ
jgi:hypothetical protein